MHDGRRWYPVDWIRLGFLLVFAVLVAAMIYARFTMPAYANGGAHFGWGFPFRGLWFLLAALLFFGLVRRAFWGPWWWRGGFGRGAYGCGWGGRADDAYHILRERYARGEITKDQYDAMMRDLGQPPQPPRSP